MKISTPALDSIRAIFARWNEISFPGDPENDERAQRQAEYFVRLNADMNRERNAEQARIARQKPSLRLVH
ncbi:hypothetical protein ABDF71_21555 [Ochrobactrum sp. WV_118_8]